MSLLGTHTLTLKETNVDGSFKMSMPIKLDMKVANVEGLYESSFDFALQFFIGQLNSKGRRVPLRSYTDKPMQAGIIACDVSTIGRQVQLIRKKYVEVEVNYDLNRYARILSKQAVQLVREEYGIEKHAALRIGNYIFAYTAGDSQ